jgi:hypothetical protein
VILLQVGFVFFYLSKMSESNEGRPGHDRWSVDGEGLFVAVNSRIYSWSVNYLAGNFTHRR